ncbi:Ectopic P granules protein 5 [Phytophthora nicotianae]|uniref:Ectopic P granules protein 5 n=2 Tax=Phytophthora nicotianae TaxID=4792 RepID=A0A0W8AZF9_PHYNI|nr:Ectopic P granules protein 5 [Phytophthora nicotianae]
MEAVRKRPQRARAAKKQQQEKIIALSFSEDDEDAAVQAAIADLDPETTDTKIRRNEEDLMALLRDGEMQQEPLVAEGAGSEPPNNHNDRGDNDDRKVAGGETLTIPPVVNGGTDAAPSAPVFEEEGEGLFTPPEQLPLQPKPSAPSPPIRTTMPRAFQQISVPAPSVTETISPSAPPSFEDEVEVLDHSSTTPSAPSLSPTASKKLHRMVASPRNPEKLTPVVRVPTKSVAEATVEGASVAVRSSFAKSRQAEKEAGKHSIYPSMPREVKPAESAKEAGEAAPASYEQLLKKKYIRVKLEPFINYEMNLMRAEASQKRQEMKMRHIETNKGELYARIERYLFSEYILHNAASTMDEYKKKIDVLVKKVWTLEKKRVSSSKRCGDNVEIEQQMEFQTAKLENLQLERLKTHLDKLRQLRTVEASIHTFDRAISYFHVEQYLNSVLQEPNLVGFLNKMSSSCGGSNGIDDLDLVPESANFYEGIPQGSPLSTSVDHLKYCLDVLIFFEKKVTLGEEGVFGLVPQSFYRGELVWHNTHAKNHYSAGGMERKIKCYACGSLNAPMKSNQWCKLCESCDVVLYIPPSSVSTKSNEWFTSVLRFRQSLQKWISTCMQSLMRTKALQNMPYLLMHVMYLPRISTDERSWFLRFLQFPRAMVRTDGSLRNEWSEDLVDHYIAMLHLVFHPEKLRRMSVIVSSGPPNGNKAAKSAEVGVADNKGLVSPEWVLLENPEMLDRYFLSDEDFVAVLNQFPNTFAFGQLFSCTSDVKKCFSRALTLVVELTHSLRAFQEFEKLPTRIAQLLGQLLADAAELPGSGRPTDSSLKDAVFYPTLFDQLFLTSLHGLMAADCNRVAWRSLSLFPFGSLSELAKWDVLALLLFNLHSLPLEAKTASGWMQFIGKPTSQGVDTKALARHHLYDLIESDTESAMYLLNAVASLAASCQSGTSGERHDLVSVAVHELFMAGYTVEPCQQALGENGERAAGPLSTICLAHPWVLSLLITLLFKFHECAATWIHIFETFPINRWMPTPQDLLNLQEWLLLEDTTAPRSALARFLLDHINWEYDVKLQRLFTDAMLHRQVALMVAEALVLYKTRKERASDPESAIVLSGGGSPQKLEVTSIAKSIRRALWLGETVDFEKWCWKLMLKLRFYSPKTHEPLLPLIDLRHDRSREALTLRRWFAGASVLRVLPSRKVFPFYTSLEEQVAHYGAGDSDRRSTAEATIGGSTGAPIQQEARLLLTPQNPRGMDIDSTISATAAPRTEPIVAYVICQMTTFVFSDRLDRWEPLLVLLKSEFFPAAIKVLENLFPILSRIDKMKDCPAESESESKTATSNSEDDGETALSSDEVEAEENGGVVVELDNELEVCMAAMQTLSTDELLSLLSALHEFSYINTDELHRMQEVLNKGYIGGWESTAKERILAKLRFVRECSRYLHPVVLPALINECFPQSSPVSVTTSALFHGAMSWISSALGGENSTGALSPSAASSTSAALSIRNSSLTATTASLAMISGGEYSTSTKALCALIRRSFEYSVDDSSLTQSMRFWVKALLQVPFWYENAAFRHVLDVMLHCSMESSYESALTKNSARNDASVLYELVALIEAAFDVYCQRIARREEDAGQPEQQFLENESVVVMSFLPAAASATFASIFGGSFDVAQYISGCPYLALWTLLIETRKEVPLFLAMGQLMIKYEPKTMKKLEKMKKTEGRLGAALSAVRDGKSLDDQAEETIYEASTGASRIGNPLTFAHTSLDSLSQYKIYRWCNYCLDLPESEPTQIIYWQVFFALYFATAGGSHVFGHHFLDRTGRRSKRVHLRKHLQVKLRKLVNYCSTQAQVVLTATSGSGHGASSGVGLAGELKERKYAHYVALSQLYTAMDAWMEEKDPNQWLKEEELSGLPRHYEVERLKDVLRLSDALLNPHTDHMNWSDLPLWTNWCGFEFTLRRTTPKVSVSDDNDDNTDTVAPSLSTPLASVGEEDDFAFVEEASELARRHSSFGGLAGLNSLTIRPLPLLPELCGPSSLTQLPTVSVVISKDRCVINPSIPLNKAGLKAVAMKFSENLSVLVALDSEMVDSVSQLYISKARTVTQSLPCPEGTNCSCPAAFKFEFLEWMMDSRMDDTIQSIRAQGERCDMRSMLVTNVMSSLNDYDEKDGVAVSTALAAEQFLQLDGDGFMLSLQILLIDQVVRSLGMEHEKLQRRKKTLENEAPREMPKIEEAVEDSKGEEENAVENEEVTPIQTTEQEMERLHSEGLEWFRLLTELDTKLSRMVPPLREALWRSIKQLGLNFVCIDERETCTLLQLMLEDPSRINLLSECFFPAAAPSRFVEMFAKLMSASSSSKLSSEEKLTLLRRFDFHAWLQTKSPLTPTKFDRDTVLCMILGDISHQFPADRSLVDTGRKAKDTTASKHLDEVLRVYAKVLQLICSAHLEDHVEKMVHALVGVHDDYRFQTSSVGNGEQSSSASGDDSSASELTALPRPVDAVVWEALVGIPLATWKELPVMQVETCVIFLSQHMTSLRWQGGMSSGSSSTAGEVLRGRETPSASSVTNYPIVYWQRLGVLKSFLDLFTLCCRVAPEQQQWALITAFFEPLLSTLYQPATNTDGSAISAPWSEQDTLSTGTTICSCFVATCSEYLKSQPQTRAMVTSSSTDAGLTQTAKLSQIWSFYLTVLVPHAPTHICKHFHQFVTRLAWEHWCLTLEIVQQMRELVQTEKKQLTGATAGASDRLVPPLYSTLSPYPYVSWLVRDVLCRTTWKSTDAWLEAQSESVCSSFLLEFAKLCVELVLDMPHFQVKSGHAASTNVLPPYFVNFIKQQSVFWAKWKMTTTDLETLQQFTLEALKEPLGRNSPDLVSGGPFPATPSAAMMQDAFTRLQLVLRLCGQITTLHHDKLPKPESLQRVNLFLKLLFGVFEVNDRGCLDGNRYTSEHAAWLMVLYGASCTALYEKLDEIVHFYKPENGKESGNDSVDVSKEGVSEEDLTATIEAVLRFCNLSLVEVFFKQMQSSPKASGGGASSSGNSALNWNKCGNVVFVEIDALVRDFASSQKALQQQSRTQQASDCTGRDESSSDTTVSATQSPAEAIGTPLGKVLWSFLAFRGGELACLAACGRALASVHVMSQVAEKSIEKWIIEERKGVWDALALRLQVPELSGDEFEAACLEQGKLLTLQVLFLQQLRRAPVLTESLSLALLTKLMNWMQRARVGRSALAQMKLLFLAAEVTNFVCKPLAEVLPSTLKKQMLRQLCDLLLELGHARRNNGIMKAIGLGGSLQYGVEFHVSCLAAGVFLRLQTRNGAPLRVDDRIPFKMTRTTEKHLKSLETMLQSKDAFQLGRRADALVDFARDPRRSLADQDEFFVTLFSSMYPAQGWLLAKCLP